MQSELDEMPSVAIVIPVYNAEHYIEETLLSAARQTYPVREIIAVNDGSRDGTRGILERLSQEIDTLKIVTVPNGGVARARNIGTERATAHYVAYLDADDLWHPTKIEKQVAALARHGHQSDWAAVYTFFRGINDESFVFGSGPCDPARGAIFGSHLVVNHVGNGSSVMVRRDVALAVGGFDPSYADHGVGGCEDRDFQLRILSQGYLMEAVPEFLVGYRFYEGNMSSNRSRMGLGQISVTERFLKDERVSDELKRLALESAHRYALTNFLAAGDWKNAWTSFKVSLASSPSRTALMLLRRSKGKLGKSVRKLPVLRRRAPIRRPFTAMDPLEGVLPVDALPNRQFIDRLQEIDREMPRQTLIS